LALQLDLVHAILERAQRQAATGRAQTSGLDRLQHAIGRETEKRLPGLSGHPCDRISSLRDACVRVRAPAASESPGWRSAARLDPRFRPGQARARRLPVAAHLGPHLALRRLAVQLDARRLRWEERAEDADRAVHEAR